jgi:hypothetical protein
MAGNYDSMVFGPGKGHTVSAENSARACDSSRGVSERESHRELRTSISCRGQSFAKRKRVELILQ